MKILMISNMYPTKKYPSYGIFVKNFELMLLYEGCNVEIEVITKTENKFIKLFKYIKHYFKVCTKIMIGQYDIIYVHYASHNALPILVANKFKRIKLYTNVHGSDVVPENKLQKKMQILAFKLINRSDKIIVPSNYFKKLVCNKYSIIEEKINVFPSAGVDNKIFYMKSNEEKLVIRNKYNILSESIVLGYVGRIDVNKGWDIFLKSIYKLKNEVFFENVVILIVGDGKQIDQYNEMIQKFNMEDLVQYKPLLPQYELAEIYNMLDLLCFPTMRDGESLGLVAIEAMACGVPVLGSSIGELQSYIEDGKNGYKFITGDVDDLAEKIKIMLNIDKNELIKMQKYSCECSRKYYVENIRKQLKEIIYE